MNFSSFNQFDKMSLSVLPENIKWISDILLIRQMYNRSELDVASSLSVRWGSAGLISIYLLSIFINAFFLAIMLSQTSRRRSMKAKILILTLTVTNLFWSVLWLFLTLSIHFLKENDEILRLLESDEEGEAVREGLWEVLAHQLIDKLLSVQSLLILAISFDRYLNLFETYSPYVDNACIKFIIIAVPFLLAWTLFDHHGLSFVIPVESALFCRLCLLLCPSLISFLFLLVSSIRPASKLSFEPRLTSSLSKSLPIFLLVVVIIDIFWRTAFFFRLLEIDFSFLIVTGSDQGNRILQDVFDWWIWMSTYFLHLFSLYFPLSLMLFIRHYRLQVNSSIRRLRATLCCANSETRVDYNCETMRSIIAEQKKKRQMVSSMH